MSSKPAALVVTSLILLLPAFSQQPQRGQIKLEPFSLVTYDGQTHAKR